MVKLIIRVIFLILSNNYPQNSIWFTIFEFQLVGKLISNVLLFIFADDDGSGSSSKVSTIYGVAGTIRLLAGKWNELHNHIAIASAYFVTSTVISIDGFIRKEQLGY